MAVIAGVVHPAAAKTPAAITLAVQGPVTVAALADTVVFSRPVPGDPGEWVLVGATGGGAVGQFPGVRPQRAPFDVDLGRGSDGGLVATYSRCRRINPRVPPYGPGLIRRDLATGCRLFEYDLRTGRERPLRLPGEGAHISRYLPARWGTRVAFAERLLGRRRSAAGAVRIRVADVRTGRIWQAPGGRSGSFFLDPRSGGPGPIGLDLREDRLAYAWGWSNGGLGCPFGTDPDTGHVGPYQSQIWLDSIDSGSHVKVARACGEQAFESFVQGVALTEDGLLYGRGLSTEGSKIVRYGGEGSRRTVASIPSPITSVAANDAAVFATTQSDEQKIAVFPPARPLPGE